jgi:tetratricopeptide (TPR) repeat protein
LSYYSKVLSTDPKDTNALYYQGLTLKNMTRNAEAISSFDKVLALEPTNTDAMYQKGLTLENMGNHTGAVYYYDKILANDPTNPDVLNSKNFAQGKAEINQAAGSNLDQQLIVVIVGLFVVISIIIIVIDRLKYKKRKVLTSAVEQGTIFEPSLLQKEENPQEKRIDTNAQPEQKRIDIPEKRIDIPEKRIDIPEKRIDIPEKIPSRTQIDQFKQEQKLVGQKPPIDKNKVQPVLDKIDKLQKSGVGNSIMLDMIRKALEDNKPVNKVEINYIQEQFTHLTTRSKSSDPTEDQKEENS